MNIFQDIGNIVSSFFKKAVPAVETAFTAANGIVNIVKTFLGTATGQTLEAILEVVAPGVSTIVFAALNTFFIDMGLVSAELTKTPSEITADGLNAISKLTGDSKALVLSNAASIIGHAISTANGGNSTIQQAMVAAPVVYNPQVLGSAIDATQIDSTVTK